MLSDFYRAQSEVVGIFHGYIASSYMISTLSHKKAENAQGNDSENSCPSGRLRFSEHTDQIMGSMPEQDPPQKEDTQTAEKTPQQSLQNSSDVWYIDWALDSFKKLSGNDFFISLSLSPEQRKAESRIRNVERKIFLSFRTPHSKKPGSLYFYKFYTALGHK